MDLRLAFRAILRRPAVSSAVVAAVALAVAITTALFSVLDGLLFRPLPFLDPDRLVAVDYRLVDGRPPELVYVRELASRREALREAVERSPLVVGASQAGFATFFDPDEMRDLAIQAHGVDARLLPLLGLSPVLGAGISVDDERSPATLSRVSRDPLSIIISQDLWRRLYGADPGALGVRELAGRPVRIVGVMAPGVKFPGETNVWAPVPSTRARPPTYVRLAPGATIEQLAGVFPELQFTPLREVMHPGEGRALPLLFGAAGLLLLVTWVQVAALMFSGSLGQIHEVGVHLALGARRVHLVRQRAIESALLAAAAFTIAWLGVRPLTAFIVNVLPADLRHGQYLSPDLRTFAFGCAISLVGLGLLTVVPLGAVGRVSPVGLLNGRLADARIRVERWRYALLVCQMTLTGLLLYLSGLSAHSLVQASTFDYGFDADHVLVFTPPPWARLNATHEQLFADFAEHNRKGRESVEILQSIPGVIGAAPFAAAPLGVGIRQDLVPITYLSGMVPSDVQVRINSVGTNFIRAFGATMVGGKSFDDPEHAVRGDVVVVNEALARRISPPMSVMGEELTLAVVGREIQAGPSRYRIVGVVKDFVDSKPELPPDPQVFMPTRTLAGIGIAIRLDPSVDSALPAVRTAMQRVWGPLRPRQLSFMRDELRTVLVPYRGQSVLMGLIAACCVPIAAIGLLGALTYSVRARTREIAIRMAIGADPDTLRRAVVRGALATVGVGLVCGIALGAAAGSVIAHQLFQVHPADVATMLGVAAGLLGLGWLAAVVPARHAARVEPAVALRQG